MIHAIHLSTGIYAMPVFYPGYLKPIFLTECFILLLNPMWIVLLPSLIFLTTNVMGTFRLLAASLANFKKGGSKNFRFLHVSNDEVYGSLVPGAPAFTETSPYDPSSPYAASKASSDYFVKAFNKTFGLPVVVTNCFNNYGPFQFPEKLIPLVILNILDKKALPVYGKGQNIRDWLYVADHCNALVRAFEKEISEKPII